MAQKKGPNYQLRMEKPYRQLLKISQQIIGRARLLCVLQLLPAAALALCLRMTPGTYGEVRFLGLDLVFGRVDQLSLVFSYVFSIMAVLGMVLLAVEWCLYQRRWMS